MPRINLLPWREQQRKERQKNFGIAALTSVIVGLLVIWGANTYLQGMIDHQNSRNQRLSQEIATLDEQIKEIKNLRLKKERLLLRMAAIEDLQRTRPEVVHLFDEMVTVLPDGAYLTKMAQNGGNLALNGLAQSNARVSTYMRNIEVSPWLDDPKLRIIENKEQDTSAVAGSTFQLDLVQVVPKGESAE